MIDYIVWIIFGVVILFCFFVGRMGEKKQFHSVVAREKQYAHILIFNEKIPPESVAGQSFHLVAGSVVMSSDYFKKILASLKSFFGGRINSYETMMDLGRREAILRMKEAAAQKGATMIFNVRLETSMLNQAEGAKGMTSAELFAYGTAFAPK